MVDLVAAISAVVTAWMAFETNRMAKATKALAELSGSPYLTFAAFNIHQLNKEATPFEPEKVRGIRPVVEFLNPGQVRVTFDVQSVSFSVEGKEQPLGEFSNHLGVVQPGQQVPFFLPGTASGEGLRVGLIGEFSMVLAFWRTPDHRESLSLSLRFNVGKTDKGEWRVDFVYLDGPSYEVL